MAKEPAQQLVLSNDKDTPFPVPTRLPYHPQSEKLLGITKAEWLVLCDSIFPSAETPQAVVLAIRYCKAMNLDIMKKPVHIVPVWSTAKGRMVETVWPSINLYRTIATRTGQYAGCDEVVFGPDVAEVFKDKENREHKVSYPAWATIRVKKIISNNIVAFNGPKVYWKEIYSKAGKLDCPNDRWRRSPYGMLEKCAEAAALRRAFPEEIGNEPTAEEMEGKAIDTTNLPNVAMPEAEPVTSDDTGKVEQAEAEPVDGWQETMDQLLLGVNSTVSAEELEVFQRENAGMIEEFAVQAPQELRQQYIAAIGAKAKSFR